MLKPRDQRPANVRYYAANREREIARVRVRQERTLAFLRELRMVPCLDCNNRFAPYQMDFDHRDPATKAFNLCSATAMLKSRATLLEEVAKCDIVCANCHHLRTRRRYVDALAKLDPASRRPSVRPDKRWRWRWHQDFLDQLRDVPCADCEARFAPCAMEFDHRDPREKVRGVTRMIGRASAERILAEVDKCDIVCANCHRKRTFDRRSRAA